MAIENFIVVALYNENEPFNIKFYVCVRVRSGLKYD